MMRVLSLFFVLFIRQGLFGQEFTERVYSGNINGISSTLRLEPGSLHNDETENRYYGMILGSDGSTYILMGDLNESSQLIGSAWDKFTAQEFKFLIEFNYSGLNFNFGLNDSYGTTINFYQEGFEPKEQLFDKVGLDSQLIGVWRRTESFSDPITGFSYVIEETLSLFEDGTLQFRTKSAGGNGGVTGTTPGQQLNGYWKTENKALFTSDLPTGPWMNNGNYLVDPNSMMLKQSGGNKLWNRIQ
jgi:hypothetical protein